MKIKMHTTIKTAIAALLLSGGAALADQDYCPITGQWIDPGSPCVAVPPPEVDTPDKYTEWHNNLTNTINQNLAAVGVGVGTGGNATSNATSNAVGGAGGKGGQGGNATGGTGGNSNQTQSQGQGQSQTSTNSASTGPISIVNDTRVKQAASSAAPALIQSTGNTLCDGGGSLSMTMQTFEWGVAVGGKKGDRFCQMVAIAGDKGGIAYLAHKDRAARAALIDIGLVVDGKTTAATVSIPVAKVPTCPAGSEWDGKGCWKPGGHR